MVSKVANWCNISISKKTSPLRLGYRVIAMISNLTSFRGLDTKKIGRGHDCGPVLKKFGEQG